MTVSVLLATANRSHMVSRFVDSLIATTAGRDVELIVAADGENPAEAIAGADRSHVCTVLDWREEMRGSSQAWNDALALSSGDVVVLAADDVEWQPGWLDAALEALGTLPDGWGFVGLNDGHYGAELATHYLMSRRFILEVLGGVIAWTAYAHSFNDVEICERARRAGRYVWCENARIRHHHWLWGDRPQDETDTRTLPGHSASQQAYQQRAALGFPNDQPPAITR